MGALVGVVQRELAAPVVVAAIVSFATPAFAETTAINAADTAWMIVATALVLMMTIPGLALFYSGMVRKKNVLATMAQSLAAVAVISILWVAFGYSLAFTGDGPWLGTLDRWFLAGMTMDSVNPAAKTIPESLFMLYQMTFAIITVALVAGSVADRMRFSAYLLFSIRLVHVRLRAARALGLGRRLPRRRRRARFRRRPRGASVSAGAGGLVAARVLGRRRGYGIENLSPFDLSLAVMGTGLLWVGWFGFNGGSALAAEFARGDGDHRHASGGLRRRADLGRDRMVDAAQAVGARHDFRRGRGARDDYAGLRLRRALARHRHRRDRRLGVLLGLHLAQAPLQLRRFARCVRRPRRRRNDRHSAGTGYLRPPRSAGPLA